MAKHIIDDSPAGLAVLLSRKHGSGDDAAPPPMAPGDDKLPAGLEDAAQDVLDAVKAGDAKQLANALHDAWSLCDGADDDDASDEGPSDGE